MKGLTYREVYEALAYLACKIPPTDDVCTEYTLSCAPESDKNEPFFFMTAKVGDMKIDLKVIGTMLVSETDAIDMKIHDRIVELFKLTGKEKILVPEEFFMDCTLDRGVFLFDKGLIKQALAHKFGVRRLDESFKIDYPYIEDGKLHWRKNKFQCRPYELDASKILHQGEYEEYIKKEA